MTHFVNIPAHRMAWAVVVFGPPDYVHPAWDYKAREDWASGDVVVTG